jgi:hypothetical protein
MRGRPTTASPTPPHFAARFAYAQTLKPKPTTKNKVQSTAP